MRVSKNEYCGIFCAVHGTIFFFDCAELEHTETEKSDALKMLSYFSQSLPLQISKNLQYQIHGGRFSVSKFWLVLFLTKKEISYYDTPPPIKILDP